MTTPEWNEETHSETPALKLLEALGYQYLPPEEIKSKRESQRSPILIQPLKEALKKLNHNLSEENHHRAIRAITQINAVNLIEANQQAYYTFTTGTTVLQDMGNGLISHTVRYLDFDNPQENIYHYTKQLPIQGSNREIIPDIVIFINGLPVTIIECKSPFIHNPINQAVEQLIAYQKIAPQAFHTIQLLVAICREQAVFGTVNTPARYYGTFPEPYPLDLASLRRFLNREPNPQDILLYSLLSPQNLLEYIRNLIAFEVNQGSVTKKLARYQQRIAIDQAIQRITKFTNPTERGGVIWHTQGSGKSLTMVWLAQKLRQSSLGFNNPTLIIVTDRLDLDAQITGTFKNVGFPNPQRAESVKHLQELLKLGGGLTILTTVQKFSDATRNKEALNNSDNIFVLVDEAHRTQYGPMAARMRSALPNATFIAFTGTPIDKQDRSTLREFGGYIHKYTIEAAVRDQATLPIFYESRDLEKFGIEGKSIDVLFERYFADYTPQQQENIKKKITYEAIALSPKRIFEIVSDLVQHFKQVIHINGFKGQIVTVNREAAVLYKQQLDKLNAPESAIIFTSSPKDLENLAAYRTTLKERKRLIERFKNPQDPLSLLIVVDMLLTGFDAPIEQVLYLDAPLKEHNLLQAIARVNRPYEGKEAGFIVDYWGVSVHLSEALSLFESEELGEPMQPKEAEIPILEHHHLACLRLFAGINPSDYEALLKVIEPPENRAEFDLAYKAFARSLNILYPHPITLEYLDDFRWLSKIRAAAGNRFRDVNLDLQDISIKLRKLIDDNLVVSGVQQIINPISIFSLEFDKYLDNLPSKTAKASEIVHALKYEINIHQSENKVFYTSLTEKLEEIIERKKEQRLSDSEQLQKLIELTKILRTGLTKEATKVGLDEISYAFYQVLEAANINHKITVKLAEEIYKVFENLVVIDWFIKENVQREMRQRLRRLLMSSQITREKTETIIPLLMEIARAKMN